MAQYNTSSDAVDVEQIMEQIRARLREKRGVDYTEGDIRELANIKLDRFLDPKNVRSDLLDHFREHGQPSEAVAAMEAALEAIRVPAFEPDDVYRSSRRGIGRVLHGIRRLLRPILKLFINPGPMLESVRALSARADSTARAFVLNEARNRRRAELDVLMYEVLNNLVVEMTRLAIDMKNHRMRVESVAARLDFDERRARAIEQIVQFRTSPEPAERTPTDEPAPAGGGNGENVEKRRRRRRRGRRRTASAAAPASETQAATTAASEPAAASAPNGAGDEPMSSTAPDSDTAPEPSGDTQP